MSRRRSQPLRRIAIAPAEAAHMLRGSGFVACEGLPLEAFAIVNGRREIRCLRARFAGGWKATLRMGRDGRWSISWGIKLTGGPR